MGTILQLCIIIMYSIFNASALWYRLNIFLHPLPEFGSPICLEIRNPWGKIMEKSGLILDPKLPNNKRILLG